MPREEKQESPKPSLLHLQLTVCSLSSVKAFELSKMLRYCDICSRAIKLLLKCLGHLPLRAPLA